MLDIAQVHGWGKEAVSIARGATGAELDYSRESVGALEDVLHKLYETEGGDGADTWDLACRMGAYLGETMLRNDFGEFEYEWAEDDDGEPILVTEYSKEGANLSRILPITRVNKCLQQGPSVSAAQLYAMCLSMLKGGDLETNLEKLGVDPSQTPGVEPAYVIAGKFSANAAAWLLFNDYAFFQENEITWDGKSHGVVGMQINAAKMQGIPMLLANLDVLNGMLDLLLQIEKDEALRIPLYMVHPGLHDAFRGEDVTGITLFNLMACASALMIKEGKVNEYQVMCDHRLPAGIPSFYQLVARMVWDMRAYNERSGSFTLTFANARNIDADVVLGDVDKMVPGAVSQAIYCIEVGEKPQVSLPDEAGPRSTDAAPTAPQYGTPKADTGPWTFDKRQRVQGRRFSFEVPDQWVADPDEGRRHLARFEEGIEDDTEYPEIICTLTADLAEDAQEVLREKSVPEMRTQMSRRFLYEDEMINKLGRIVDDWVVEGRNCTVLVIEVRIKSLFPGICSDTCEYYVKPISYDYEDSLRIVDSYDRLEEGSLKELAFAVASTVELDKPVEPELPLRLERYCRESADAEEFCEGVYIASHVLNVSANSRVNANLWRAVRRADNDSSVLRIGNTMRRIEAEAQNDNLKDNLRYLELLVCALEKQAELGADGLDKMRDSVKQFADACMSDRISMEDKEEERAVNSLGIIVLPEGARALLDRLEAVGSNRSRDKTNAVADRERAPKAEQEVAAEEQQQLTGKQRRAEKRARQRANEARKKAEATRQRKDKKQTKQEAASNKKEQRALIQEKRDDQNNLEQSRQELEQYRSDLSQVNRRIIDLGVQIEKTRKSAPETQLAEVNESLKTCNDELNKYGFFAFGKKSAMKEQIERLEKRKAELEGAIPSHYEEAIEELDAKRRAEEAKVRKLGQQIDACERKVRDLKAAIVRPMLEEFRRLSIGDHIKFGRYPQTSRTATSEPIGWTVVEQRPGMRLLLSDYVLDYVKFNDDVDKGNDYRGSSLEGWLKNTFKQAAFSKEETFAMDGSPFVMTAQDFSRCLPSDAKRICRATAYAQLKGKIRGSAAFYWLATAAAKSSENAYVINPHGHVMGSGVAFYFEGMRVPSFGEPVDGPMGVRPAVWVKTDE